MNKALLLKIFVLILGLSVLLNAQSNTDKSQDNQGTISKSFNVSKGGTLNVKITSGDIKISTWNKNEVNIKITSDDKEDINSITAVIESNIVKISNNYSSSWGGWTGDISLNINIPSDFNTEINTQSGDIVQTGNLNGTATVFTAGGDIKLGDVSGQTTLKSNGGDITTGNVGGDLTLSTNGGDVITGIVNGKININTMGGGITVAKAGKDLNVNTMGGDISIGNIGGKADVKTMGGSISISNISGGANISTYGGDISLTGANGNVDATTYGGNISMKNISGSVNLETKSGDINVDLSPSQNNSEIKSMNGNVVLYLPSNAKINVSATVITRPYDRNNEKNEMMKLIHSDFESVNVTNVDLHDNKVTAKYAINGGGNNYIEIYTVNGSIKIRKK